MKGLIFILRSLLIKVYWDLITLCQVKGRRRIDHPNAYPNTIESNNSMKTSASKKILFKGLISRKMIYFSHNKLGIQIKLGDIVQGKG